MASLWEDVAAPYAADPQQPSRGMFSDVLQWLYGDRATTMPQARPAVHAYDLAPFQLPPGQQGRVQQNPQTGAIEPSMAGPSAQDVASGLYGMTGLPDLRQAYEAYQRGEYLQALGQGGYGAANAASLAIPALRAGGAVARAPLIGELLANEAGGMRFGRTPGRPLEPEPFSVPPGPSSLTGIGSIADGGIWTPSAPAIIKPPEGLDYRGIDMAARPDVSQFALDRPPTWVKELPKNWAALDTPQTWERYKAAAAKGLPEGKPGGREWYNTMPLLRAFMEINPSTGAQDYRRYIDYVGASSPDNVVPQNIRTASWLYHADKQGLDLPTIYRNERGDATMYPPDVKARLFPKDAEGNELKGAARRAVLSGAEEDALRSQYGLPTGYGGKAQAGWVAHAGNIRSGGAFDLMKNPKPPSFVQNLLGNYEPFTIDRHNMRVMTGWTPEGKYLPGFADAPPTQAYGYLERLQQDYARRLNLDPAQTQAATWLGGETGVKSDLGRPFVGEFEQKLYEAAARARISPQELLRDFVLGNRPL